MFFRTRLMVNRDLLGKLRLLTDRALVVLRRKLVQEFGPELQTFVDEEMAGGPSVSSPFQFGGPENGKASREFYFWVVRHIVGLSDGAHWIRGGEMGLESAWRVEVSDRLREAQIKVVNIQREDKIRALGGRSAGSSQGTYPGNFVFGPFVVPGHFRSGWPARIEEAREKLQAMMVERLQILWQEAVTEAWNQ
jgi:hypothetical protein